MRRALAEMLDPGEDLLRGIGVGIIGPAWRQVGFELHAVKDVLVVEEGEGFEIEREVEAPGRTIAPLLEQIAKPFGDRGGIGILTPEGLGALAQAIVQLQE